MTLPCSFYSIPIVSIGLWIYIKEVLLIIGLKRTCRSGSSVWWRRRRKLKSRRWNWSTCTVWNAKWTLFFIYTKHNFYYTHHIWCYIYLVGNHPTTKLFIYIVPLPTSISSTSNDSLGRSSFSSIPCRRGLGVVFSFLQQSLRVAI